MAQACEPHPPCSKAQTLRLIEGNPTHRSHLLNRRLLFCACDVEAMKHPDLQWNPETHEWFCIRCFKTSDHTNRRDAEEELSYFDCITADDSKPRQFERGVRGREPMWLRFKPTCLYPDEC
jgi:hypothetical protein